MIMDDVRSAIGEMKANTGIRAEPLPKIVAHMMCRNEADVIEETVGEILRWVDTLVVLDGNSTDGTWQIVCELAGLVENAGKVIDAHQEADPDDRFADTIRNRLLELTAEHRPDWVISVDADEIYHCDHKQNVPSPVDAIRAAETIGANVVQCAVPQFWYTFEDLRCYPFLDQPRSIQISRRFYSWGHVGRFIWRWNPDHYYPQHTPKRTPELPGRTWREWQRTGPLMPICKHYTHRTPMQIVKRAQERLERGGRQYFGKYALWRQVLDEKEAGLHYLSEDETWCMENNHDLVYQYMGGGQ